MNIIDIIYQETDEHTEAYKQNFEKLIKILQILN